MPEHNQTEDREKLLRSPKGETGTGKSVSAEKSQAGIGGAKLPPGRISTRLIAIGASLGGTEAILSLLKELPPGSPGILVVQHMPAGFTAGYAQRLDRNCGLRVVEAKSGILVEDGLVVIAKGGEQLTVFASPDGFRVHSFPGPLVNGFCPSVDVLFKSVAKAAGKLAAGVILTGIGRDGAAGLKAMHDLGAPTWGQSKDSCVVYGMPDAAFKAGAVDKEKNLKLIGRDLSLYFKDYHRGG